MINSLFYIFSSRLAVLYIRLGKAKEALNEFKYMYKIHKINKKNIQVLFGILCNKLYLKLANIKDKKRGNK